MRFLFKRKYEVLLLVLIFHLFGGILILDEQFYMDYIWPLQMILIGIACVGIYSGKRRPSIYLTSVFYVISCLAPLALPFIGESEIFWNVAGLSYNLFFLFIFGEIILFLLAPGYVDKDIIIASACGFFLIIEMGTHQSFLIYNNDAGAYSGLDTSSTMHVFVDLIYFNTITLTTIGFGDITPNTISAKLNAALIGAIGMFYNVILVGILVSKYTSASSTDRET